MLAANILRYRSRHPADLLFRPSEISSHKSTFSKRASGSCCVIPRPAGGFGNSGLSTSSAAALSAGPDRSAVSKQNGSDQPCLCLCFGFSQITRITPLRFTTLHLSHMGLTDALTFTMYAPFFCIQMIITSSRAHSYPMCSFQTPLQYITVFFQRQGLFFRIF